MRWWSIATTVSLVACGNWSTPCANSIHWGFNLSRSMRAWTRQLQTVGWCLGFLPALRNSNANSFVSAFVLGLLLLARKASASAGHDVPWTATECARCELWVGLGPKLRLSWAQDSAQCIGQRSSCECLSCLRYIYLKQKTY